MPTYEQLQSETWWGREIVTAEMDWLGDELCRRTGRPRTAAGTKGDNWHLSGAHRSQEWLLNSRYCTNRGYTVQSGLTATQARHIAGFDFTPGSAEQMIAQCKRLMAAMKAGRLDEVRELYGNVDGDRVVDGWDNVRDRAVTSDDSHLWHWHLTLDRRHCTNRNLMERILAIAFGEDDDMTPADLLDTTVMNRHTGKPIKIRTLLEYLDVVEVGTRTEVKKAVVAETGKVAAKVDALTAAFTALAKSGTSIDTAAVLAEVRKVGDDLGARLAEAEAEVESLRAQLAAAAKAEADALAQG